MGQCQASSTRREIQLRRYPLRAVPTHAICISFNNEETLQSVIQQLEKEYSLNINHVWRCNADGTRNADVEVTTLVQAAKNFLEGNDEIHPLYFQATHQGIHDSHGEGTPGRINGYVR